MRKFMLIVLSLLVLFTLLLAPLSAQEATPDPTADPTAKPSASATAQATPEATAEATAQPLPFDVPVYDGPGRRFALYLPDGYNPRLPDAPALPLVVVLHGAGGTGREMLYQAGWSALADQHQFMVLLPDAYDGSWRALRASWLGAGAPRGDNIDDSAFIAALIGQVVSQYPVDLARIYAVGFSNGGIMTYTLACEHPNIFAAIGVVAATMFEPQSANCAPDRAVPLVAIHGTIDRFFPMDGEMLSAENGLEVRRMGVYESLEFWANYNGCDAEPVVEPLADFDDITRETYTNCRDDANVLLYLIDGGGHVWPGAGLPIARQDDTFFAVVALWEFLAQHAQPE